MAGGTGEVAVEQESAHPNQVEGGQSPSSMFELIYAELRTLAAAKLHRQSPAHTLSATALVHEAYLRLANGESGIQCRDRGQFLALAAKAMQSILVDHARRKRAEKRGGAARRCELRDDDRIEIPDPETVLAIHEAVEALAIDDPVAAEIARARLFAGLSIEEAADAAHLSRAGAYREWSYARAFIETAITGNAAK